MKELNKYLILIIASLFFAECSSSDSGNEDDDLWDESEEESDSESDDDDDNDDDDGNDNDGNDDDDDDDGNNNNNNYPPVTNTDDQDTGAVTTTCPENAGTHQCFVTNSDCMDQGGTIEAQYTCRSGECCRLGTNNNNDDDDNTTVGDPECEFDCMSFADCMDSSGIVIEDRTCDNQRERCCDLGASPDTDPDIDSETTTEEDEDTDMDAGVEDGGVTDGDGGDDTDNGDCSYTCMSPITCLLQEGGEDEAQSCDADNEICCNLGDDTPPTDTAVDDGCQGECLESVVTCVANGGERDPEGICEQEGYTCCLVELGDPTDTEGSQEPTDTQDGEPTDTQEPCPFEGNDDIACLSPVACAGANGIDVPGFSCAESNDVCCVLPEECPVGNDSLFECVSASVCENRLGQVDTAKGCGLDNADQVCCEMREPCPEDHPLVSCKEQASCEGIFDRDYECDGDEVCCVD